MRPKRFAWLCAASLLAPALVGCPNQEALGYDAVTVLGPGVINDPENRSLRFDILKFGLDRFCFEMTRRGVPLKLADDQPVAGRFFADTCQSQLIDEENRKSIVVQYSGKGYGWTSLSSRIGFTSSGLIEYAPDFRVKDDAMYIYFRPRNIQATNFNVGLVESSFAKAGMSLAGFDANAAGRKLVDSQLSRGFTVIRYSDKGETDFGMGVIALGGKPFKPFQISKTSKVALENNRTEVHQGQQEFIGGFEVTDDDQALYFTAALDGAAAVDVFVIPKGPGDQMLQQYVTNPGPAALPMQPLLDNVVSQGQPWKGYLPLPKGIYYLIVDNASGVGQTNPPQVAGDDRAAKLDYLVQLGDRQ
ncbi:MAG: hypothetical protein AB7K71_10965 [Polyangiaceae bacterium]